jgi:hypothetical protein
MLDTETQGADKSLDTGATPSSVFHHAVLARLADEHGAAGNLMDGINGF